MVTFARYSDTSLTEETGKGSKTGATLVVISVDTVRHGGRCPAAHTETDWLLSVIQGKSCGEV